MFFWDVTLLESFLSLRQVSFIQIIVKLAAFLSLSALNVLQEKLSTFTKPTVRFQSLSRTRVKKNTWKAKFSD
jgi:hypothetical protein